MSSSFFFSFLCLLRKMCKKCHVHIMCVCGMFQLAMIWNLHSAQTDCMYVCASFSRNWNDHQSVNWLKFVVGMTGCKNSSSTHEESKPPHRPTYRCLLFVCFPFLVFLFVLSLMKHSRSSSQSVSQSVCCLSFGATPLALLLSPPTLPTRGWVLL